MMKRVRKVGVNCYGINGAKLVHEREVVGGGLN
jgi:hypothetical protein